MEASVCIKMDSREKESCCSGQDRISILPEEILQMILLLLPLKEAARTSVLSRIWRNIWTKLPELRFNMSFCNELAAREDPDRVMLIICRILLLHSGFLHKFTLSLPHARSSSVDCVLRSVCNNALKDFNLALTMGEYYKLTTPFFSCRQLVNLFLGGCEFRPPPGFGGFAMLTSLELFVVKITGDVCSNLVSSCPRLEKLTLRLLTSCGHLDIVAPNLRLFYREGTPMHLCFRETLQLERLTILFNLSVRRVSEDGQEKMVFLYDNFSALKYVKLTSFVLKYMIPGTLSERLQNDLTDLKAIILCGVSFEAIDEAKRVLCLLRSSPGLAKINVRVCPKISAFEEPARELLKDVNIALNNLREVVMWDVVGSPSELLFIEFLLANAPVLDKMVIDPLPMFKKAAKSFILGKVMQFQCASPRACIKYGRSGAEKL